MTAAAPLGEEWAWLQGADDWTKTRALWRLLTADHPTDPRPDQLVPDDGDWNIALYMAGRGWGKTRVGAEDTSNYAREHPGCRIAVVAETFAAGRDVCIEGESGLLSVVPPDVVEEWNRSQGELRFTNGSRVTVYSSEKPEALRGPQHHRAWVDELAKFRNPRDAWDNLMFGLRLGTHPQVIVTTTPKPITLLRELVGRADVRVIRGSTFDNARNLAPTALEMLRERYEGTRTGRQELYAELLDDYEGALWSRDQIDRDRLPTTTMPELARIAIGIDPSGYSPELADRDDKPGHGQETGIIAVGIDRQRPPHVYVLEDASGRYTGAQWAQHAVGLSRKYADIAPTVLVPETNLAGPLVLDTIRLIDPNVRFHTTNRRPGVRAARGKRARAEEPAAVYEQGRAHHVGYFADLEDQLCTWDPEQPWSPDRLDALAWAIHALKPWQRRSRGVRGIGPADVEELDDELLTRTVDIPHYEHRPDAERLIGAWKRRPTS